MYTRKFNWLRILCIALLPLLLTVGCAKRDAQKAMTQAQAAKDEASTAKAPGYAPKAFNDAKSLFDRAQQQFDAGSYKDSIDLYQQAEARFKGSVEVANEVKPKVQAVISEIDQAIATATQNMEKARAGGTLAAEDINPVQTQLDALNQRLETEIRSELDMEKLNAFLAEVQQFVTRTESLALAHLKPQAATAKEDVQKLIARAQELKADVHVPDRYGEMLKQFQDLEASERDGQWQVVIDKAATMTQPLNEIIQTAQEKAAGDILQQVGDQIAQAKQLNVQIDSFAAAVQQAQTSLQSGQSALQNKDYAGAITSTDAAKAALNQAYQAVGQQAQQNIDAAKANLQKAIDQEANQYAASAVAQVQESISGAEELIKGEKFVQAFTASQRAVQSSSQTIDAARRGKAQLALNTVEQPFSILQGQGGAQYAPDAYKQALASVQDLRDKMKQGQYEDVVTAVPPAVQVVQGGLDALAKSTGEILGKADLALQAARESEAPQWVGVQYANAVNLKAAADKSSTNKRFLESIHNAESAIRAAQDAESKAYQLQTDQNLRKVDDFMALAKRAEQDRLSPLAYRQAQQSREAVVQAMAQKDNKEAYKISLETVQKSDRAYNNLVMTAKEKSDSALAAEAMQYSESEIKESLAYLNKAEEAQKARDFTSANQLAIDSAKLSEKAEDFTWKQRSYRLLRDLEGTKEQLEHHLAPEKTPALYEQVLTNLAEAQVAQIDQDYKSSYDYADKAAQGKQQIWDSMKTELEQVLAQLKQTADWMGQNALDPDGREIKTKLLDVIPSLEQQIALKDWQAAYAAADQCLQTSKQITAQFEKRNRVIMTKELQSSLHPFEKQGTLSIVPEQKTQFKETLQSLDQPKKGETYGDIQKKFQSSSDSVEKLPDTIMAQAEQRGKELETILQQADQAGATKFYKDWYRDQVSNLQMLRNAIQGKNFSEISSYIRKLETESPKLLAATQLRAAEEEYLSELEKNLNQMNNVFQEFGFLGNLSVRMLLASRTTEHKLDESVIDMYKSLQSNMSVRTLRVNAELLEDTVKSLKPPKTLVKVQKKAVESFESFTSGAKAYETYGQSEAYDMYYRDRALKRGYENLHKALKINDGLLYQIKEARNLQGWDKFLYSFDTIEEKLGDFYMNYETF